MTVKRAFYLETSIWGRLIDRRFPARRRATRRFLEGHKKAVRYAISARVMAEIDATPDRSSRRRMRRLIRRYRAREIPKHARAHDLLAALLATGCRGSGGIADLDHIAYAVVGRCAAVLTWNMAGMATSQVRRAVSEVCRARGMAAPLIGTPEEVSRWLEQGIL